MDFRFSEEQEFFRSQVRDAVQRLVIPKIAEIDQAEDFPRGLWDEFAALGYFGLRHPERYGGMDADTVTSMIFFEELARGSVGFSMAVTVQMLMGTYFVGRFGSEAVKQRVLVPAIKGEKVAAICFTEDQSGSDLAGTQTTAVRDGDSWVLNGRKQWVTNGPHCDFATVLAQTQPGAGLKGLSFFLVENGTPGFLRGQMFHKLGSRGSMTGELVFDNVRVPLENHLGEELGRGIQYSTDILNLVRVMTGLNACAIARGAMEEARDFARKRVAFGEPIASYQLIRAKFGKFFAEHEAARTLLYRVAWMIDEGMSCQPEAMAAKYFATEMCLDAVDQCTRIYGGNAFASEYAPQRFFRDARFLLYGGGTHEVLLNFLGRLYVEGKI
jgi:alkylation response protein AidB-like acyl-CoA dehydrogenase